MSIDKILVVGNTNYPITGIRKPLFINYDIKSFDESMTYSEDELKSLYVDEVDRICELFNKTLLPSIIDKLISSMGNYPNSNIELERKLLEMKESKDFSSLYARTDFFDIKYFTGSKHIGTFNHYRIDYQKMDDVCSLNELINKLNSRGKMSVNINIHYMRGHFYDYMFDTLRHEMAHAFVHIYFTGLLKALTNVNYDIKPHGKEWKWVAHSLGARPKATTHVSSSFKEEVIKSMEHYNRTLTLVDGNKMNTKKKMRHHYYCGCTDHWITTQKRNKILRGLEYRCVKCKNTIKSLDKHKYVY